MAHYENIVIYPTITYGQISENTITANKLTVGGASLDKISDDALSLRFTVDQEDGLPELTEEEKKSEEEAKASLKSNPMFGMF